MMHLSVWGVLSGLLLLAVPILAFRSAGVRLVRQLAASSVGMLSQIALASALVWSACLVDHWAYTLASLLLLSFFTAWLTVRRARLRRHKMLLPVCGCLFVSVLAVALYVEGLVLRVGPLLAPQRLLPVGAMLMALTGNSCGLALREYFVGLVRFSSTYYFKVGNGASWHGAVMPMVRRSLERACRPLLARMRQTGLFVASLLLSGLLMAGWSPLHAAVATVSLAFGAFAVVILTYVMIVVTTHRLVIGKRGNLNDCVRMKGAHHKENRGETETKA